MKRPLVGIAIAFLVGILIEAFLDIPIFFIFGYALISLLLSLLSIKSERRFLLPAFICFVFIGALIFKNYNRIPENHIKNVVLLNRDSPKEVLAEGRIINNPVEKLTYYKQKQSQFLLAVKAVRVDGEWKASCGILLVNVFNPAVNFKYADDVILEGNISIPRGATNPGQFDYKKFLERKKIFYTLIVKEENFSRITGRGRPNPVRLAAYRASKKTERMIVKFAPGEEGSILKAILLGNRQDIEEDINDDFVKTGTVHVLAISGLHVGLLASLFILLFKLLRFPFKIWAVILAVFLIFYCIMVDSRPPVVRSTVMILVFLFGRVLKRDQDLLNSLAFSALIILIFNPQDVFDIGFQLSFLTVGSIIYFTPGLEAIFIKRHYLRRPPSYFSRALIVSFCAWLGSAPFIARYFNIFSPVTVAANLFIVPWMFIVLANSLIFILFGFLSEALGLIFSEAAKLSVLILLKAVSIFREVPFSYFIVKSPPWPLIAGFYIFLFLFFNRARLKVRAKYFLIAGLIVFNLFIWRNVFFNQRNFLKVTFLDVGKGDSFVLEFPKGGVMLIDAGEGLPTGQAGLPYRQAGLGVDMGRAVVSRFLETEGVNKIDAVIATHPHTDHIGGLVTVLKNFKVGLFVENGDREENPLYRECQELIKQKRIKKIIVRDGDCIKGFKGAQINVLNPPDKSNFALNDDSLVIRLAYGDFSIIFCGDVGETGARNLLARHNEGLASTVLKVPHHGGSMGSVVSEFIEKINPGIAIISVRNRTIDSSILVILKELRTRIYRTDRDGAITFTADARSCDIDTYRE